MLGADRPLKARLHDIFELAQRSLDGWPLR